MDEPVPIQEVLRHLVKEGGLGEQLEQARIWENWPQLAGETLWMHGRPVALRDGTLIVEAESAAWMHRFSYYRFRLLGRINKMAKKRLVTDVFVRLDNGTTGDADDA
jgi:predicted nucleic acid-binding Zn ribbon protein